MPVSRQGAKIETEQASNLVIEQSSLAIEQSSLQGRSLATGLRRQQPA